MAQHEKKSRSVSGWRKTIPALFLGACMAALVGGQTPKPGETGTKPAQSGPPVDQVRPTYRGTEKDPFFDPTSVRAQGKIATPVQYPTFAERQEQWRRKRSEAMERGLPVPEPSELYLVDELDVKGVFGTNDRGSMALLKHKASSTTFFVREGSKFFNGSVNKIDKSTYRDVQKGTVAGTVLCSEVTLYSDNSVRTTQRNLQYVPK